MGVSQVAEPVYSTKLKTKTIPYTSPATDGLSGTCASPWSPLNIFFYGPSSNAYQQTPRIIKVRRTDGCSWREEQGLERPWWPGIKHPPSRADSVGSAPGGRTETPRAVKQLSPTGCNC